MSLAISECVNTYAALTNFSKTRRWKVFEISNANNSIMKSHIECCPQKSGSIVFIESCNGGVGWVKVVLLRNAVWCEA